MIKSIAGTGTERLISTDQQQVDRDEIREIEIDLIQPGSTATQDFLRRGETGRTGPVNSHDRDHPTPVSPTKRPHFELVAGERRWRAAKLQDSPASRRSFGDP